MNDQQFETIVQALNRIAAALEGGAPALGQPPNNPWASPEVPYGYDTVVGYFSKVLPTAFNYMDDPVAGTQRDGYWLTHQAHLRGLRVVPVEAPEPMKSIGIETINAYPLHLLEERIAA